MTKREVQEAIRKNMKAYNEIMPTAMRVTKADNAEWYSLFIGGTQITSGTLEHVLTRIKGINRENGI